MASKTSFKEILPFNFQALGVQIKIHVAADKKCRKREVAISSFYKDPKNVETIHGHIYIYKTLEKTKERNAYVSKRSEGQMATKLFYGKHCNTYKNTFWGINDLVLKGQPFLSWAHTC